MSKATELTVTINAKLDVDKKTAETCLMLIEAFMNNHPDVEIMCTQLETGEREYRFYNKLSEEENDDGECAGKFMQDVLSLINRQKEEIKRLKNRDLQVEVSEKLEREIKAEAVKEFADRLKERASKGFWETDAYIGVEQIEELVKEMVGENNAE